MAFNREFLSKLDLGDDVIEKIMAEHGKDEANAVKLQKQVNDLSSENNSLKEQVSQSTKQLEELKNSHKDDEDLQSQIQQLQEANIQLENENAEKLAEAKKNFAIDNALRDAGALETKAVLPFIDLETIKLDGDKLMGLDEQLKSVKESKGFLFKSEEPKPGVHVTAGGNPESGKQVNSLSDLTLEEQNQLYKKDPAQWQALSQSK
jgi:exonuclease VII large subunit